MAKPKLDFKKLLLERGERIGLSVAGIITLLLLLVKDGALKLDFNDEIVKGACVTHDGAIVNPRAKELVEAASR